MWIEVVESIAKYSGANEEAIEDPAVKLALQNFRSAVQSEDSLFDSQECGAGPVAAGEDGLVRYAGEFLVTFRDAGVRSDRGSYFQLIQKLMELLRPAGSQDVIRASLCLVPEEQGASPSAGLALRIHLEAEGDSREQAALRWGLGLAQFQQALLFTSRHLRQKGSQEEE